MTLAGIDVSTAGQGTAFNWAPYRGKVQFAFTKVSEGTGYADPSAARNIAQMRAMGITPGGYHFLHNELPGAQQAEWFLECAAKAGLGAGGLVAVDVEDLGMGNINRSDPEAVEQALIHFDAVAAAFSAEYRKHHANWPLMYTEISIAPHLGSNGNSPLWLANPSGIPVKGIGPWKQVSMEQVGQRGVDTDTFYGTAAQLAALAVPK